MGKDNIDKYGLLDDFNDPHLPEKNLEVDLSGQGKLFLIDPISVDPTITFHCGDLGEKEVLKFTKDKMYLYGKECDAPKEIIEGMRFWLTQQGYLEIREKARKYDELTNLINKQNGKI